MVLTLLFSCKTGNYSTGKDNQKEVLIYYSKGPCLGKCPIYDFWVFTDGNFVYKEANKTRSNKNIKGQLAFEEVDDLVKFMKEQLGHPTIFRPIRDKPKTVLRFEDKEFEYYATKINGSLKEVDIKLTGLVNRVLFENRDSR